MGSIQDLPPACTPAGPDSRITVGKTQICAMTAQTLEALQVLMSTDISSTPPFHLCVWLGNAHPSTPITVTHRL